MFTPPPPPPNIYVREGSKKGPFSRLLLLEGGGGGVGCWKLPGPPRLFLGLKGGKKKAQKSKKIFQFNFPRGNRKGVRLGKVVSLGGGGIFKKKIADVVHD